MESIDLDDAFYRKLQISCLEFSSAHKVPALQQNILSLSVIKDQTDKRFLHYVFTVYWYHESGARKFDIVVDEANAEQFLAQSCKKSLWFVRLLLFLIVSMGTDTEIKCCSYMYISCENRGAIHKFGLAFVQ